MSPFHKRLIIGMVGALAMAGCAPIRPVPVSVGIEQIEPTRSPLPSDRTFRRDRRPDQKRRLDSNRRRRSRIGGRKRGR